MNYAPAEEQSGAEMMLNWHCLLAPLAVSGTPNIGIQYNSLQTWIRNIALAWSAGKYLRPSNCINVDEILAIRFERPNLFSLGHHGHHPSSSLKYPILQTTCLLPAVFDATILSCRDYAQIDRKLNTENGNKGTDTRVEGRKEGLPSLQSTRP